MEEEALELVVEGWLLAWTLALAAPLDKSVVATTPLGLLLEAEEAAAA